MNTSLAYSHKQTHTHSRVSQWWTRILTKIFTCSGATHVREVITIPKRENNILFWQEIDTENSETRMLRILNVLLAINYKLECTWTRSVSKKGSSSLSMMLSRPIERGSVKTARTFFSEWIINEWKIYIILMKPSTRSTFVNLLNVSKDFFIHAVMIWLLEFKIIKRWSSRIKYKEKSLWIVCEDDQEINIL